jgi:hypothetical protein
MAFRSTVATTILVLATAQAIAQGQRNYWGEGGALCSVWTKERQSKTVLGTQLAAWVRGYVTGANVMQTHVNSNIFDTAQMDTMEAWINRYCISNPSQRLIVGADALVVDLIARAGER